MRATRRGEWQAVVDRRSGSVHIAEGAGVPWIPGYGNDLQLNDISGHLRGRSKIDLETMESIARSFISDVEPLLGSSGRVLHLNREASGLYSDYFWLVEFDVYTHGGLKIEGARLFFRVNNGNLIQYGSEQLPPPGTVIPQRCTPRRKPWRVFSDTSVA